MRCFLLLLVFSSYCLNAQDFEGVLRYGISYEGPNKMLTKYKLKKKDTVLVSYVKNKNFLKYINNPKDISIYVNDSNVVYLLTENEKELVTFRRKTLVKKKNESIKIQKNDTLRMVNNFECKEVEFDFGYYKATVYYVDNKYLGAGRSFYYYSFIDSYIKNSFLQEYLVVRFIQEFDEVKTIVNLLELKEQKVDESIFTIPAYKRSRKYTYEPNEVYSVYKIKDKKYKFPILKY